MDSEKRKDSKNSTGAIMVVLAVAVVVKAI
jgi:hypothetical protein